VAVAAARGKGVRPAVRQCEVRGVRDIEVAVDILRDDLRIARVCARETSSRRPTKMARLRVQWRDELIFQVRYAGLSVPLWVKNVRTVF
jgi:hypothetical protein